MVTHVNLKGDTVKCDATQRTCPRGGHSPDILSEIKTLEKDQVEQVVKVFGSLKNIYGERGAAEVIDNIFSFNEYNQFAPTDKFPPLKRDIFNELFDTPLKNMNSEQLTQILLAKVVKYGLNKNKIASSIGLAALLHGHQNRGPRGEETQTPYIEHPLRNAVRLCRMGVRDEDVILATVLHDTIEDGAGVFSTMMNGQLFDEPEARVLLGRFIEGSYGGRVLNLVQKVTNDYIPKSDATNISVEQKHKAYFDHVKKVIEEDPDVMLVKLVDFIDNASGLHYGNVPGREDKVLRQSKKYLPLIDVFQSAIVKHSDFLTHINTTDLALKLERTRFTLLNILNKNSK